DIDATLFTSRYLILHPRPLHYQRYDGDRDPTGETEKYGPNSVADELQRIGPQADGGHRYANAEFPELRKGRGEGHGQYAESPREGSCEKSENEPGDDLREVETAATAFRAPPQGEGENEGDGDYHERPRELDDRGVAARVVPVRECSCHHRRSIVYGRTRPQAESLLCHAHDMAQGGE